MNILTTKDGDKLKEVCRLLKRIRKQLNNPAQRSMTLNLIRQKWGL